MEALLVFLKQCKIPVCNICLGDVTKNDIMKVITSFDTIENPKDKKKEYKTMLCFDVKILLDAAKFAEENNVKIIVAPIIYHLFDGFTKYV